MCNRLCGGLRRCYLHVHDVCVCVYICPLDRGSVEDLVVTGVRVEGHYDVECTIGGGVGGWEYHGQNTAGEIDPYVSFPFLWYCPAFRPL